MNRHTPAPLPDRSVYGFVIYLGTYTVLSLYLIWAYIPDRWLHAVGLTYWPQKYWALAVPVYFCVAILTLAYFILPSYSLLITPSLDSTETFQDSHSRYSKDEKDQKHELDIPLSTVCHQLYLHDDCN